MWISYTQFLYQIYMFIFLIEKFHIELVRCFTILL
jgi:hypothetical protein